MSLAVALWLDRLLSGTSNTASLLMPAGRKPMEIQVERLPDYFWRDLGFQQPRGLDGE
jgi:hypothetical protein